MSTNVESLGLGPDADRAAAAAPRRQMSETPILVIWSLLVIATTIYVIGGAEHRAVHDPIQRLARGEITAKSPEAMFRPANLARALGIIRGAVHPGEKLQLLTTDTGKVEATVVDSFDNRRDLRVDLKYKLRTRSAFKFPSAGVPLASFDIAAPLRFIHGVRRKVGSAGALEGFTFSSGGGLQTWSLKLSGANLHSDDENWIADGHGRDPHRPGETTKTQIRISTKNGRKVAACIQRGHGVLSAVERCTR